MPDDAPPPAPQARFELGALCHERRQRLDGAQRPADGAPLWGLALSGGGIRSATFSFGLLKALAQKGLFHRFDLLSTVSGGGYLGATVGKLYQQAGANGQPAAEVEAALGEADTRWFAFWLRANGRYLIPRGGKDLLFAAANFGRNLLAVHLELALLGLLLGCLLVTVNLALWQWADCLYSKQACWQPAWVTLDTLDAFARWPSLWLLLPPLALAGAALATAYWALPSQAGQSLPIQRWLMVGLCLAGGWTLWRYARGLQDHPPGPDDLQAPGWLLLGSAGLLLAWLLGTAIAGWLNQRHREQPDRSRHWLTQALARVLNLALIVTALGLIDVMAWLLAVALSKAGLAQQGTAYLLLLVGVAVLRAVLPKIADLPRALTPGTRVQLLALIHCLGVVLLLALLVFWVSVVHRAATLALFDEQRRLLQFSLAWRWLAALTLPPLLMVLISWRNREFLNRSSLFAFYRARLVRSYLGAANPARFAGSPKSATEAYARHLAATGPQVAVQDLHADDDLAMTGYAPHAGGGPVHLLNVCVNQTRDPRGGLFNQDRKGLLMTIGPQGRVRVGQAGWRQVAPAGSLSLGAWMAISGAAVAPGLGGSTRSGLAALLTMAGLRLGYWWDSGALEADAGQAPAPRLSKYAQLLAELRGRFDGTRRADWYLSDGGHFENTGVYALLREECEVIVLADCGADPRYAFGDLENLVRKARIDLQAEIAFLKPRLIQPADPAAPSAFGSLNELVSGDSQACLALAQIQYRHGGTGHLVVVKPNMCAGLSVDLVNFKADHPLFPQEPTTDQFFSEAQWESYFQLGHVLGGKLPAEMLRDLSRMAALWFEPDDGSVQILDAQGQARNAAAPKRLPSRIAATGAVTASISLGALASLSATAWQAVEHTLTAREQARKLDPGVLKELSDLYGKLLPASSPASAASAGPVSAAADSRLGELATALLRIGDAACTLDNTEAFRRSELMQLMLRSTKRSCRESSPRHPSCDTLINEDRYAACLHEQPQISCVPRYWLRDFNESDPSKQNCARTLLREPATQAAEAAAPGPAASPAPGPATGPASSAPATTASAPAAAASAAAAMAPEPGPDALPCKGKTIFIQIYGPELRERVRLLREPWRALGASVPPVEDVWDSARRRGRSAPQAPAQPTVIHHDDAGLACALRLRPGDADGPWRVQALAPHLAGTPGTIEVWLPPAGQDTKALPDALPGLIYCYQEDSRGPDAQRYGLHCHAEASSCERARGPSALRLQSSCSRVATGPEAAALLRLRGWGGSWYALQAKPFEAPYPALPAPATPATSSASR